MKILMLTLAGLALIVVLIAIPLGIGILIGCEQAQHRQYVDEEEVISAALSKHPEYAHLEVWEFGGGGAVVNGTVTTPDQREMIHDIISNAIGEMRAKRVDNVFVLPEPEK